MPILTFGGAGPPPDSATGRTAPPFRALRLVNGARATSTIDPALEVLDMGGNRFTRSPRPRTEHLIALTVEVGQVVCPARGITDIEHCFTCSAYRGLQDGPAERLVCAPVTRSELAYVPLGFVPR
ncbi:MAG TPA: hypothetical protein VHM48_05805 [Candidatus Limnocylindrales bacterium]|nr:hypothetical protein [Candidatus Limnocylindrales bacterium]